MIAPVNKLDFQFDNPNNIREQRITGTAPDQTIYIGIAERGTATSAAGWQVVRRVISNSGLDATIRWSAGKQIFDNFASLTYT